MFDLGEASAIALASEISCDYVILDDMAARKLAEKIGLPIKGTVGRFIDGQTKRYYSFISPIP